MPSPRSRLFDLLIALSVSGLALAELGIGRSPVMVGIGVVMGGALFWRRTRPVATACAVAALGCTQVVLSLSNYDGTVTYLAPCLYDVGVLIAVHAVTKYAARFWQVMAAGVGGVIAAVLASLPAWDGWWRQALMLGAFAVAVWAVGLNARTGRLYAQGLEERAAVLEREQRHLAEAAAAGERARIAREMHDVIAHALAGMIAQVDGAAYAIDGDPAGARKALTAAGDAGRTALAELQGLVGVLREPPEADPHPPHRRPLGSDRVGELADWARGVGLDTTVRVSGDLAGLPVGVALAVHRIVQEALTNVLKHAGPGTRVDIDVARAHGETRIEITDHGRAIREAGPGGHGLAGMRERVAVYGGVFEAGPLPVGWRVLATIPDAP
ncbi:two-component sensor histidine kinase [Actinorhabdospora filicis]|uniref:histidine kinase n=1 Tax=Actinorhabdospora filicis TaxID=1785913 RepID=A0A9W6SPW3_9ACTN|nr:histidine kinase [Actinorhabdospora filicis]GLZ79839.1 two-component sensor histidine kinase [Actinorhabdospora filicis]